MAEKRTAPEMGRRKRTAPTIDLTPNAAPPSADEPNAAAPEPAAAEQPEPSDMAAAETPPPPPASADEPPAAEQSAFASAGSPPPADPPDNEGRWLTAHFSGPVLAAGLAGAGSVAILLLALWLTGLVPIRYAGSTATRARVTALEMEVQSLQHRPAGVVDSKALDALSARVDKLEQTATAQPQADAGNASADAGKISELSDRLAAAENAMKSVGVTVAALGRRNDDLAAEVAQARARAEIAEKTASDLRGNVQETAKAASTAVSSSDLDALQKRVADLEQAAKSAQSEIAKTGAAETSARLALSAVALRDAAVSGAPFDAALGQAKALGADAKALSALEPFAATGIPSAASLSQELRALVPEMIKLSGAQPTGGGFLDRLQANASHLVRIRPVGAPNGDDATAVLGRIELEAAKADINGALGDLAKLPDRVRAPAQAWTTKAQSRQAAIAAAGALVAHTATALGPR